MTTDRRIALLIPCFNASGTLPEVLAGARAQSDPFDEIICYDDASTDDTADVARSFGIRVMRAEKNRGASFGRTVLAHAATAPFLHFHDDDDPLHPGFVGLHREFLAPGRATICGFDKIYLDGRRESHTYATTGPVADPLRFTLQRYIHFNSVVFDRECLIRAGGFNPRLSVFEEMTMFIHYLLHGGMLFAIAQTEAAWRLRARSVMHTISAARRNHSLLTMIDDVLPDLQARRPELAPLFTRYCYEKLWDNFYSTGELAHAEAIHERLRPVGFSRVVRGASLLGLKNAWRLRLAWSKWRKLKP